MNLKTGGAITLPLAIAILAPLAACERAPDLPERYGLTKAEVCIPWRQQRMQAGSNNGVAAEMRLATMVVAPDKIDDVEEYIDYAREHC